MRRTAHLTLALALVLGASVWILAPPAHAAKATLDWQDMSNNEDGFNVERKGDLCSGAAAFGQLAQVGKDVITYVDQAVVEGGKYCYRVNAYNTAGASAWSNSAEITIAYTVPPPPSGAALATNRLTWVDNSTNETGFIVDRKAEACAGTGAFTQMTTMPKDSTSWNDANVVEGGTYCYRVAATNPAGKSAYSNLAERTVPWTTPVAPGTLKVVAGE